ncbi:MAG: uracil-DNA glycosylase [Rickettsiales bacterium]
MSNKALLEWQLAAGVDEAIDESPTNYFALKPSLSIVAPSPVHDITVSGNAKVTTVIKTPEKTPLHLSPSSANMVARELADACKTIAELEEAVRKFDGCALKKTATKTVFADGNSQAKIMLIGEAPDAQEDIQGIPFCGASGQLLDKMLLSIGLDRTNVYISNTIFWRPPGNRQPNEVEVNTCLPFVEKHIALVAPKLLILSGGTATNVLLKKDLSISRLRGKLYEYSNSYIDSPLKTAIIYHPSYLLRQPLYKKQAWQDLLMIKHFLAE